MGLSVWSLLWGILLSPSLVYFGIQGESIETCADVLQEADVCHQLMASGSCVSYTVGQACQKTCGYCTSDTNAPSQLPFHGDIDRTRKKILGIKPIDNSVDNEDNESVETVEENGANSVVHLYRSRRDDSSDSDSDSDDDDDDDDYNNNNNNGNNNLGINRGDNSRRLGTQTFAPKTTPFRSTSGTTPSTALKPFQSTTTGVNPSTTQLRHSSRSTSTKMATAPATSQLSPSTTTTTTTGTLLFQTTTTKAAATKTTLPPIVAAGPTNPPVIGPVYLPLTTTTRVRFGQPSASPTVLYGTTKPATILPITTRPMKSTPPTTRQTTKLSTTASLRKTSSQSPLTTTTIAPPKRQTTTTVTIAPPRRIPPQTTTRPPRTTPLSTTTMQTPPPPTTTTTTTTPSSARNGSHNPQGNPQQGYGALSLIALTTQRSPSQTTTTTTTQTTTRLTSPPTVTTSTSPIIAGPTPPPPLCYQCGDASTPCSPFELLLGQLTRCPPGTSYCMVDIVQIAGTKEVRKRCVDQATCRKEWFDETSDQARCINFDSRVTTTKLDCHFCCDVDGCNKPMKPLASTWYMP